MRGKSFSLFMLTAVLLFLILAGAACSAEPAAPEDSATPEPTDADRRPSPYGSAHSAYEKLSSVFSYPTGGPRYPEDFSGAWIEGKTLTVALTSFENIGMYQELLSDYACVNFVQLEYSLNDLDAIKEQVVSWIRDQVDISCWYTEERTQTVVYEVVGDVEAARTVLLRTLKEKDSQIDPNLIDFRPGAWVIEE